MNKKSKTDYEQYFIQDFIYHFIEWFRKLWIFILVFAVIGASALVAYTYASFEPQYSASATFTVNVDVAKSSAQQYNKATANQLAKTFPNILTSGSLNKIVCRDLGVEHIDEIITASVIEDTNLFTITVTSSNPQRAYNVLKSVISNYPEVAKFIIGSTQLTLIDTSSVSTMPINYPNYPKKAVMGCAVGVAVGLVINVLLAITTSTIIRASDITQEFNTVCLGSIPECTFKKRSSKSKKLQIPNIEEQNSNYKFKEGMFSLRNTLIRKCREKDFKSILVTSTISGEGKSVVATNIARSIAMKGYKTVLVDFDLRVPNIYEYMEINNDINSVSNYIKGEVDLKHCVYSTHSPNLFVAVERHNNDDASELVGSENAKKLINELSRIFEFVIIDTPPIGYLSDSSSIADYTDAVVYVIAQDVVSRKNIGDGLSAFDNLKAEVLGCVINRITKDTESVGYGKYGYKRYAKSSYKKYESKLSNDNEEIVLTPLIKNGIVFEEEND